MSKLKVEMNQEKTRLWNRYFILLLTAHSCAQIGYQILVPSLPVYFQTLGKGEQVIGMLAGLMAVTAILSRPYVGKALDSQNKRNVYITGLFFHLIASGLYVWGESTFILSILRLLHGFGIGITTAAAATIAADFIPKNRLAEGVGFFSMATVVSMAVAPATGLYFANQNHYTALFSLAVLFIGTAILVCLCINQKEQDINPNKKSQPMETGKKKDRTAVIMACIAFCVTLPYSAIVTFLALYAKQEEVSNIGWFFIVYAGIILLARPAAGRLADRKGEAFVVIPSMLMTCLSLLLLSAAGTFLSFMMVAILLAMGYGTIQPALQSIVLRGTPAVRRGRAMSTFFLGMDISYGIGPFLCGVLVRVYSYSTMFFLSIIFILMGCTLYFFHFYLKERDKNELSV